MSAGHTNDQLLYTFSSLLLFSQWVIQMSATLLLSRPCGRGGEDEYNDEKQVNADIYFSIFNKKI